VIRDIREGLGILAGDPTLRAIAVAVATFEFSFGIVGTVISLYALRELGFTPGPLGLIFAVGGVASLVAALLAGRVTGRLGVGPTMVGGLLITGLGILLLPLAHGAGLIAFLLLIGQQVIGDGGATVFEINQSSLRQRIAPARALARVGAGVALGPITGRVLAQALTGEHPGVDLAPFDPDRFARAEEALEGGIEISPEGTAYSPTALVLDRIDRETS